MRTHDRFEVQLVAAEPLVTDPVDIAWGADGTLWVVEMGDYPLGADGRGKPGGRIRSLKDTDGDHHYDKSTVFLDNLMYPSGVMPWKDGVLVLAAPNLLFARDADGDGTCDTQEVLFDGFRTGNPQHLVNGLIWGLDNWIYIANGDSGGHVRSIRTGESVNISGRDLRVRPVTGDLDAQSGMTQFSRPRDDWGNWFGCNNSYPLWHYVLHDHYLRRNPHVPSPAPDINITEPQIHPPVFPASQTIERFNDYHTANRITSACGVGIYRDQLLGDDLYHNAFICEPVHNLVYRQVLTPDGATFKARRADEESRSEFLASTDNWFRPVTARTGPDGALYVVDMYRHVIEHPEWIPPEWEATLDLRAGHDRGRIYRVVRRGKQTPKIPDLTKSDSPQLIDVLESSNGELRDLAHQLILQRNVSTKEIASLRALASSGQRPTSRVQALCVLEGVGALDETTLEKALQDPVHQVRREAIRLCEGKETLLPALTRLAQVETETPVVLQLANSLGEFSQPEAGNALAGLLRKHGDDRWVRAAVFSSCANHAKAITEAFAGMGTDEIQRLAAALKQVIVLAHAVSPEKLLPDLARSVAPELAKLGTDSLPIASQFIEAGITEGLEPVISMSEKLASDVSAPPSDRASAIQLLASTKQKAHLPFYAALLTIEAPAEVQAAAVRAMAATGEAQVAPSLLSRWKQLPPTTKRAVINACLDTANWAPHLLQAAKDDTGILSTLNSGDRERLKNHSLVAVREKATALFSLAPNSPVATDLDRLSAAEKLETDRSKGAELFRAQCSICHQLEGIGVHVGPELTSLTDKSFTALLTAIVDPNAAVEDKYQSYLITTNSNETLLASIDSESATTLTLKLSDGSERALLRKDVKTLESTGKSLMPEGLGTAMEPQDIADVIAFLQQARPPRREFAGNRPQMVHAEDGGQLRLLSTKAAIYGPTIRFSTRYRQLENWSDERDEVVWQVNVPKAGNYKVEVDASVNSRVPDNSFQIVASDARLVGDTPVTNSENDFRVRDYGTIQLTAGEQEISMRSNGAIKRFLLDLRGIYLTPTE